MLTSGNILLFDGVCNLCNGLVRFIIRRDPDAIIKFASLQSPAGQSLLERFDLSAKEIDSVVYITGDKRYLKSSAVLHLLNDLSGGWRLFYSFIIIPGFIRDFFYNLISINRYRIFGKTDTCMVPAPDIMSRFLL